MNAKIFKSLIEWRRENHTRYRPKRKEEFGILIDEDGKIHEETVQKKSYAGDAIGFYSEKTGLVAGLRAGELTRETGKKTIHLRASEIIPRPGWENIKKQVSKSILKEVGDYQYVRESREKTGMSQKEFSDYMRIPQGTIEDWESGRRNPIDYVEDLIAYKINHEFKEDTKEKKMTVEKIIQESDLSVKDKRMLQRLVDDGTLRVINENDLALFKYWIEHEQIDSYYRPVFYGGYTPERFQKEQVEQFGDEVDLTDEQWYKVLPDGIIEYVDDGNWTR